MRADHVNIRLLMPPRLFLCRAMRMRALLRASPAMLTRERFRADFSEYEMLLLYICALFFAAARDELFSRALPRCCAMLCGCAAAAFSPSAIFLSALPLNRYARWCALRYTPFYFSPYVSPFAITLRAIAAILILRWLIFRYLLLPLISLCFRHARFALIRQIRMPLRWFYAWWFLFDAAFFAMLLIFISPFSLIILRFYFHFLSFLHCHFASLLLPFYFRWCWCQHYFRCHAADAAIFAALPPSFFAADDISPPHFLSLPFFRCCRHALHASFSPLVYGAFLSFSSADYFPFAWFIISLLMLRFHWFFVIFFFDAIWFSDFSPFRRFLFSRCCFHFLWDCFFDYFCWCAFFCRSLLIAFWRFRQPLTMRYFAICFRARARAAFRRCCHIAISPLPPWHFHFFVGYWCHIFAAYADFLRLSFRYFAICWWCFRLFRHVDAPLFRVFSFRFSRCCRFRIIADADIFLIFSWRHAAWYFSMLPLHTMIAIYFDFLIIFDIYFALLFSLFFFAFRVLFLFFLDWFLPLSCWFFAFCRYFIFRHAIFSSIAADIFWCFFALLLSLRAVHYAAFWCRCCHFHMLSSLSLFSIRHAVSIRLLIIFLSRHAMLLISLAFIIFAPCLFFFTICFMMFSLVFLLIDALYWCRACWFFDYALPLFFADCFPCWCLIHYYYAIFSPLMRASKLYGWYCCFICWCQHSRHAVISWFCLISRHFDFAFFFAWLISMRLSSLDAAYLPLYLAARARGVLQIWFCCDAFADADYLRLMPLLALMLRHIAAFAMPLIIFSFHFWCLIAPCSRYAMLLLTPLASVIFCHLFSPLLLITHRHCRWLFALRFIFDFADAAMLSICRYSSDWFCCYFHAAFDYFLFAPLLPLISFSLSSLMMRWWFSHFAAMRCRAFSLLMLSCLLPSPLSLSLTPSFSLIFALAMFLMIYYFADDFRHAWFADADAVWCHADYCRYAAVARHMPPRRARHAHIFADAAFYRWCYARAARWRRCGDARHAITPLFDAIFMLWLDATQPPWFPFAIVAPLTMFMMFYQLAADSWFVFIAAIYAIADAAMPRFAIAADSLLAYALRCRRHFMLPMRFDYRCADFSYSIRFADFAARAFFIFADSDSPWFFASLHFSCYADYFCFLLAIRSSIADALFLSLFLMIFFSMLRRWYAFLCHYAKMIFLLDAADISFIFALLFLRFLSFRRAMPLLPLFSFSFHFIFIRLISLRHFFAFADYLPLTMMPLLSDFFDAALIIWCYISTIDFLLPFSCWCWFLAFATPISSFLFRRFHFLMLRHVYFRFRWCYAFALIYFYCHYFLRFLSMLSFHASFLFAFSFMFRWLFFFADFFRCCWFSDFDDAMLLSMIFLRRLFLSLFSRLCCCFLMLIALFCWCLLMLAAFDADDLFSLLFHWWFHFWLMIYWYFDYYLLRTMLCFFAIYACFRFSRCRHDTLPLWWFLLLRRFICFFAYDGLFRFACCRWCFWLIFCCRFAFHVSADAAWFAIMPPLCHFFSSSSLLLRHHFRAAIMLSAIITLLICATPICFSAAYVAATFSPFAADADFDASFASFLSSPFRCLMLFSFFISLHFDFHNVAAFIYYFDIFCFHWFFISFSFLHFRHADACRFISFAPFISPYFWCRHMLIFSSYFVAIVITLFSPYLAAMRFTLMMPCWCYLRVYADALWCATEAFRCRFRAALLPRDWAPAFHYIDADVAAFRHTPRAAFMLFMASYISSFYCCRYAHMRLPPLFSLTYCACSRRFSLYATSAWCFSATL